MNIKFSTAVLKAANELASSKPSFSLHEVTRRLRDLVNQNVVAFSDKTPENVNGTNTYRIEHDDVRAEFDELYRAKALLLNRKSNGQYFEYSLATSSPAPLITAVTSNVPLVSKSLSILPTTKLNLATPVFRQQVAKYLIGFASGSIVTMKQVQSRFDSLKGITCVDFASILESFGYFIDKKDSYPSKWFVSL